MKWSKYNIIYHLDSEKDILYNYAWKNVIILLKDLSSIVSNQIDNIENLYNIHPELYQEFIIKKIIIDDKIDESELIIKKIKEELYTQKTFYLTINPTLDCNLKCWYCYESHIQKSFINQDLYISIIKFIEKQLSNTNLETLNLTFFGGEPLLKASTIALPLAQDVNNLCEQYKKSFNLRFITNGVLLSKKTIDKLYCINKNTSFQIAFDGGRDFHNKTKYLSNTSGTYDIVLDNINYGLSKGFKFIIRCNYTRENIESFACLIDDLCKLKHFNKSNIILSLQRVWQSKIDKDALKKIHNINNLAKSNGLMSDIAGNVCSKTYCYADYKNSCVINYNGDIFKCTARDFNKQEKIGHLSSSGEIIFTNSIEDHFNARFKKTCIDCKLLPICSICTQVHKESDANQCPKIISEKEKDNQIVSHLKEVYSQLFKEEKSK